MRAAAASMRATRAASSSDAVVGAGCLAGSLAIGAVVIAAVETGVVETGSGAGAEAGALCAASSGSAVLWTGKAGVRGAGTAAGSVVCDAGGADGAFGSAGTFAADGAGEGGCDARAAPRPSMFPVAYTSISFGCVKLSVGNGGRPTGSGFTR